MPPALGLVPDLAGRAVARIPKCRVRAVAYKLENPTSAKAGIYAIPTSEEDRRRLAARIADDAMSGDWPAVTGLE